MSSPPTLPAPTELLPHDTPMVMVDTFITETSQSATSSTTICTDSMLFNGSGVPAWAGIEYMAQTIGLYSGRLLQTEGKSPRIGFLVGTRAYTCHVSQFDLGQTIQTSATLVLKEENGLAVFDCDIRCPTQNQPLATARIKCYLPEDIDTFIAEISV